MNLEDALDMKVYSLEEARKRLARAMLKHQVSSMMLNRELLWFWERCLENKWSFRKEITSLGITCHYALGRANIYRKIIGQSLNSANFQDIGTAKLLYTIQWVTKKNEAEFRTLIHSHSLLAIQRASNKAGKKSSWEAFKAHLLNESKTYAKWLKVRMFHLEWAVVEEALIKAGAVHSHVAGLTTESTREAVLKICEWYVKTRNEQVKELVHA